MQYSLSQPQLWVHISSGVIFMKYFKWIMGKVRNKIWNLEDLIQILLKFHSICQDNNPDLVNFCQPFKSDASLIFSKKKLYVVKYHYCHVGWRKMILWDVFWMRCWFVFQSALCYIESHFEHVKVFWSWGLNGHVPSHVPAHTHTCTQARTHAYTNRWKKKMHCIWAQGYCYYDVIPSGLCLVWPHFVFQQYSEPKHTFRAWKVYLTRRRLIEHCARWPYLPFHLT